MDTATDMDFTVFMVDSMDGDLKAYIQLEKSVLRIKQKCVPLVLRYICTILLSYSLICLELFKK